MTDFSTIFESFVKKYQTQYGSHKLDNDMQSVFYNKTAHIDTKQFETVTNFLLGSQTWPFKFTKILERQEILFPSSENLKVLEGEWKLEHDKKSNIDVKEKMSQLLTAVPQLVKLFPNNWRDKYFEKHVALLGIEASTKIAQDIQNQFPEFKEWIYREHGKQGTYEEVI